MAGSITTLGIATLVAGSSVLAALVTQGTTALRDWLKGQTDSNFSGLYLALNLERYATLCASVVADVTLYIDSDEHDGQWHSNAPELLEFPDSIEWKSLGIALATEVMSLRVLVEQTRASITDGWFYLDDEEKGSTVTEHTARLGLRALAVADGIRRAKKLAPLEVIDDWGVRGRLERRVAMAEQVVEREGAAVEGQNQPAPADGQVKIGWPDRLAD